MTQTPEDKLWEILDNYKVACSQDDLDAFDDAKQAIKEAIEALLPEPKSLDNVGEFNFGWNFAIDEMRQSLAKYMKEAIDE